MGPAVRRNELTEAIMPRIPPIATKDQLPPEHQYVFDQVMDVFGRVRGPFSMLLHSPKLAERLLPMVPFASSARSPIKSNSSQASPFDVLAARSTVT